MKKKVLISINKPHTDNIKSGIKKVDVRKNMPTIPTPFSCLIYETKRKGGCGKVIGEFICDSVIISNEYVFNGGFLTKQIAELACLSVKDMKKYSKGKTLFAWHISDLIIYYTPKELSEFGLTRPPQNWKYIRMKHFEFDDDYDDFYDEY